jgi:hypothetical protein
VPSRKIVHSTKLLLHELRRPARHFIQETLYDRSNEKMALLVKADDLPENFWACPAST